MINGKKQIVPGLMACGQAAVTSVHGSQKLGGNSFLDQIVFGRAAALRTKELYQPGQNQPELPKDAGEASIAKI